MIFKMQFLKTASFFILQTIYYHKYYIIMHIIVTGYADPKVDINHRFAEIRLVVKEDQGDNPTDESGNTMGLVNGIETVLKKYYPDLMEEYGLTKNLRKEEKSNKGDAAVRLPIRYKLLDNFLNEDIWNDENGTFLTWLNNKKFKDVNGQFILDDNGNKKIFTIPFVFDVDGVKEQVEKSATMDDYYAAESQMKDYVASLFQTLDKAHVQSFLRNFCGHIKLVNVTSDNGWEYVQLSTKNSLMVYTQYNKVGITPKFVCSARDWARYFNRRLIPNAIGAVIEVPYRNKRLDVDAYKTKTNSDFNNDMAAGGTLGYRANVIGYNQNDVSSDFYPGWVYDESQTELMIDKNGNALPDIFNDPQQQRRVTNLGNDSTLAYQSQQNDVKQSISNGTTNPFSENLDKIPQCLENIKSAIESPRFFSKKSNSGKFDSVKPYVENAIKIPTLQTLTQVIKELAYCELYQIENTKHRAKKEEYAKIIMDCVMLCCGFGKAQDMATYAKRVLNNNKQDAYKVWEHINNIVNIVGGSKLIKEDDQVCKPIDFETFLDIVGMDDETLEQENQMIQENIKKINTQFKTILNKL